MKHDKTLDTNEAWESGALGRDAAHVKRAGPEIAPQIDDALGLQMISIRLPKEVIADFKMIAQLHGVGYQPLMRDALIRFADAELKTLGRQAIKQQTTTGNLAHDAELAAPPVAQTIPVRRVRQKVA